MFCSDLICRIRADEHCTVWKAWGGCSGVSPHPFVNLCILVSSPQTIVELFFQEVARKHIISRLFLQSNTSLAETSLNWPHLITAIVADFLPLLYPWLQTRCSLSLGCDQGEFSCGVEVLESLYKLCEIAQRLRITSQF